VSVTEVSSGFSKWSVAIDKETGFANPYPETGMRREKTVSTLQIREFDGSDAAYEMWCAICNAVDPDHIHTAQEIKHWEQQREARIAYGKWFGIVEGEAVGVVEYSQMVWAYHPQKFSAFLAVLPEKQGAGIGKRLFEHLMAAIAPLNPLSLRCDTREDWARSVKFVADRGFQEDFRIWESRLDVHAFDPAPFAALRDKPSAHGIVIKTAAQLKAEDPGFARKLWEMDQEASEDVPTPETFTPLSFETYHKMILEAPNFLPEGFFVALDGQTGEYAGLSVLWKRQADDHLDTGFTGVRRKYRRLGIAMALKLRAVEYARSVDCPVLRTDNATSNRPMLAINEALGFEKQPVWISLAKTFPTTTHTESPAL
jgi:GNAT superfamily N-acetyltransferase